MSKKIILTFCSGELIKFVYDSPFSCQRRMSFRGNKDCPGGGFTSFPWSSGVKALALLLVRARRLVNSCQLAALEGKRGSPALCLDYAISKNSAWLTAIFGCDSSGISYAQRILIRLNSNCKRPGPVVVMVNPNILQMSEISLEVDGKEISADDDIAGLEMSIESNWTLGSVTWKQSSRIVPSDSERNSHVGF